MSEWVRNKATGVVTLCWRMGELSDFNTRRTGDRAFKPRWRTRESEQVRNFCTWYKYECVRHAKYDLTADERTEGRWRRHLDKSKNSSQFTAALCFILWRSMNARSTENNNKQTVSRQIFSPMAQVAKPTCCCYRGRRSKRLFLSSDNCVPRAPSFCALIAYFGFTQWAKTRKKVQFGRTMHCLSQRLWSTFFEIFSSGWSPKETWSEEKISKKRWF